MLPLAASKTNINHFLADFNGVSVKYYRVIGPAPFNYSIHRHYEPATTAAGLPNWTYASQATWFPGKGGAPVGMVLNRMDFRTPEPTQYKRVDLALPAVPADTTSITSYTKPYIYKVGTGEAADDVFPDCHYNMSLSPNSIYATDPLDGSGSSKLVSSMMPRPGHLTDYPEWYSRGRLVSFDSAIQWYTFKSNPYMPDQQPFSNPALAPNNTVGIGNSHP